MKIPKSFKLLCIISIVFSIFAITSLAISAEAYEVTSLFDYSGTPENWDEGTLRYALEETNDDVITFSSLLFEQPNRTIYLNEQLVISRDVKIEGPSPDQLIISGQDLYRIFKIAAPATSVDISGLSLTNGNGYMGGAIYHESGQLIITSCDFTGNTSIYDQDGGAIYSTGEKLTVNNCSFTNNLGGSGGAIYVNTNSASEIDINSSYFSANISNNYGGALYLGYGNLNGNEVNIKIENSEFHNNINNTAGYAGGAIYVLGPFLVDNLHILSCNFSNNDSTGNGGAIACSGTDNAVIEKSYFSNNSSNSYGGAIYLYKVISADINSCVLSGNNSVSYDGGGIYSQSDSDSNSIINLKNSTINGNSANYGGGIAAQSYGTFNLLNCTIAENSASGNGGGIKSLQNYSTINISNCTIYGNSRETSDQYGNAISNSGTMNLINTIVACNTDGDGTTDHQIYNVPEENISFSITSDDIVSSDIFAGDLAENDGPFIGSNISADPVPLRTLALKPGSPAIDTASSTDIDGNVVSTDQRGATRPQGSGYDIGSFETNVQTFAITAFSPYGGTIAPTSADVVEGGEIEFTITPNPGYILSDLVIDEDTSVYEDVDENGKYTLANVTEPHTLNATFEIDSEMLQEAQTASFGITGTTGTTNHPPAVDNPVGITEKEIISLSVDPVSSNDIGTDLSGTNFASGVSFEIGFESPDQGMGVTQVDLELMITSTDLGAKTFDAISQGNDLETAFFENVSLYKVLNGQAYNLFNLAADYIGMDDVYDFFIVTEAEDAYKVAMTIVIADMAAPQGTEPVLALNDGQELIFFVYDGNQDGKFSDPVVALKKVAEDPDEPVDETNLNGGSCSIGVFTPLAGLLVLPLLFMFKK